MATSPATLADGTVKPNIGVDYAPTGLWTDLLGKAIPDSGDPEYAKQLIAESGETPPVIRYQYRESSPAAKLNAGVVEVLAREGRLPGRAGVPAHG